MLVLHFCAFVLAFCCCLPTMTRAFLDVQTTTVARRGHNALKSLHSFNSCMLYTPPIAWRESAAADNGPTQPSVDSFGALTTCTMQLQTLGESLIGQAMSCAARKATHGRDFFVVELSRDGNGLLTRLPAKHLGGGRYSFVGWHKVWPGPWNATVTLWATATARLLAAKDPTFSALRDVDYMVDTRDYVWNAQTPILQIPLIKLPGTSTTVEQPASLDHIATLAAGRAGGVQDSGPLGKGQIVPPEQQAHQQCSAPAKGVWVRLPPEATGGACPKGLCLGSVDSLQMTGLRNMQMGFRHVYKPHTCQYKMHGTEDALACLGRKKVLMIGNSRTRDLSIYLQNLLRGGAAAADTASSSSNTSNNALGSGGLAPREGWKVGWQSGSSSSKNESGNNHASVTLLWLKNRVGLMDLLSRPVAPGGAPFLESILAPGTYDHILINSALHDVADFNGPAVNFRKYGWKTADVGQAGDRPAGHACVRPNVTAASTMKFRAVAQYIDTLGRFSAAFQRARTAAAANAAALAGGKSAAEGSSDKAAAPVAPEPPRVFWLFHGYRPAEVPACYPNQLDRMLCLQAIALRHVEQMEVEPIDLATLQQDAPARWFDDNVHVGRKSSGNGLGLMALQVMLNTMCAPRTPPS